MSSILTTNRRTVLAAAIAPVDCNEEVRFLFTRLSSTADDIAPQGSFLPYEVSAPPGGQTFVHADVDVKSFDLEFAKTIPLGGGGGCECGDPCGCGDACGSGCGCPAWDVTWSGGFRFADVDWNRTYTAVDDDEFVTTEAVSSMNFRGGGLRVGLEGRRYFFDNGCMSVYLKGDISLLLGDVRLNATRITDDPTTPDRCRYTKHANVRDAANHPCHGTGSRTHGPHHLQLVDHDGLPV